MCGGVGGGGCTGGTVDLLRKEAGQNIDTVVSKVTTKI